LFYSNKHIKKGSTVHTDANQCYKRFKDFYNHDIVKHSAEFVSKKGVHVNMVESFWGLLKRGVQGQFHHISQKYLQNYINEFSFRFNRRRLKSEVIFDEVLMRGLGC
jgi:transposase